MTLFFPFKAPRPVIVELEGLVRLVHFERQVEGVRRTTSWFLRQRIAFAYCTWYSESLNGLLAQYEAAFGTDLETLVGEGCWLAAASLSTRALEGCNKFRNNLDTLHKSYGNWLEWRGHTTDDWPSVTGTQSATE